MSHSTSDRIEAIGDDALRPARAEQDAAFDAKAMADLKISLQRLPVLVLAADASGTIVLAEGGDLVSWRAARRPAVGTAVYDLLDDSPELVDGFDRALAGQGQRCRTFVGDRVFELTFSPVSDDTCIRACCMAQDITERAESERQRVSEQVAAFEQHRNMAASFRALIEALPLGIVVTRSDRIVFFNVEAGTCLRWAEPKSYLGREFSQFFVPASRRLLASTTDAPLELTSLGEVQITTGDGKVIMTEVQSVGIEFDGSAASLFSIRDLTHVHRMEQDLRQAQRLEAIGRLAAGIAHEINTPIQFIGDNANFLAQVVADMSGYLKVCEGYLADPAFQDQKQALAERKEQLDIDFAQEEAPKAAASILDGVSRVAKIVSAMKSYAHPGSAEKSLSDVNRALENTVVVATNEWKSVAKVVTDLGDIPLVPCRLGELNQVFLNLLVNAAHAIGAKPNRSDAMGLITIRTYVESGMVVIAISDDGGGIPPEIRDRVFDPFFTTKEVGRGTGQGLTLARRVVTEQHGGVLDFTSEVGRGTTFFVRLPLKLTDGDRAK